jgi:hypothetical protein
MATTLGAAAPALAQQAEAAPPGDRWTVEVAPYLWAAALDGNATVGGIKADVDVPFSDLLKDLSGGAMLLVSVEKGRFGIGVNGLFARVSSDSDVGPIEIDATSDTGQLAVAHPTTGWWSGSTACRPRAGRCVSSWRPRRAFASPTCAPSSRFAAAGPSIRARAGSTVGSRIGLDLSDRWKIAAGGSTEICQVFIGRVDAASAGGIFGLAHEGEDIKMHVVPLEEALKWLGDGRVHAATTIVALQWLALHRAELAERGGPAAAR